MIAVSAGRGGKPQGRARVRRGALGARPLPRLEAALGDSALVGWGDTASPPSPWPTRDPISGTRPGRFSGRPGPRRGGLEHPGQPPLLPDPSPWWPRLNSLFDFLSESSDPCGTRPRPWPGGCPRPVSKSCRKRRRGPWRPEKASSSAAAGAGRLLLRRHRPPAGWNVAAAHTDSPGWRLKTAQQTPHEGGVVRIGTRSLRVPHPFHLRLRPSARGGRKGASWPPTARRAKSSCAPNPSGSSPNLAYPLQPRDQQRPGLMICRSTCASWQRWAPTATCSRPSPAATASTPSSGFSADLFAVEPSPPRPWGRTDCSFSPHRPTSPAATPCRSKAFLALEILGVRPKACWPVVCFGIRKEIGSVQVRWSGRRLLARSTSDVTETAYTASGGGTPEGLFRAKAASFVLLSVDSAHGVHPNWAGQHNPAVRPVVQGTRDPSSSRAPGSATPPPPPAKPGYGLAGRAREPRFSRMS